MLSKTLTDLQNGVAALPQFSTLTDLQNVVLGLPQYATEPPKWFIHREHYALIIKSQYKYAKAIRKAKARKKRINAKCGR